MDPLSVACGAAQFLGLAGQALQGIIWIRQHFREIKYAPRLIKNIHHELKIFEGILTQLSSIEESCINEEAAQSFTVTLSGCADLFEALCFELDKHDFEKYDGGPKKLWKQIVANDKRSDFEEYLRRLERAKSSLLTTMAGLQLEGTKYVYFRLE